MNYGLIARSGLRIVALIAVYFGYADEGQALAIYTNPDVIAIVTLAISESFFLIEKWRGK
jgi:hypothetical protein